MRVALMLTDSVRARIWNIANSYYSKGDWAHDKNHVERVVRTAIEIGKRENADLDVIELAAILHDISEYKEYHSKIEAFRHEVQGAIEAMRILKKLGMASNTIEAVAHCIEAHRKRASVEPRTIEAKCLFDADKLDAIGAIGIIRSAFISFDHGQEFYKEEDIDAYRRRNIRPDGRITDPSLHSSNLEYELSLKAIPNRMYTKTGKRLAKDRAAFMDEFYDRIGKELKAFH